MIRFLVRYRGTLLLVMALLAVGSLLLIPRIKINSDLSKYLPESSRMKQGMDRLAEDFPQLDTRMRTLDVMFTTPIDADAVGSRLDELTGGMLRLSLRESPPYTLFQYRISGDGDPGLLLKEIKKEFGNEVAVEISGDDKMPANLGFILLLGVSLAFPILVMMCASWMEVPLFLITVGIAVIINMGTNAFLESVSMMTNSMVAVLQMVLSMDYSIIVMNRMNMSINKLTTVVNALLSTEGAAPFSAASMAPVLFSCSCRSCL